MVGRFVPNRRIGAASIYRGHRSPAVWDGPPYQLIHSAIRIPRLISDYVFPGYFDCNAAAADAPRSLC
jgi:hypothetical protein